MNTIKTLLKSKVMWIGLAVGVVLALAFRRFIPKPIVNAANMLPGSDAKKAVAAA